MAGKPPSYSRPSIDWSAYKRLPGIVLGFHGCNKSTGEAVIRGEQRHLTASRNLYDWLGEGIYFWEWDPWRALNFAEQAMVDKHLTKGVVTHPYVVGAVIDLGYCLNLVELDSVQEVKQAWDFLEAASDFTGTAPPENKGRERGQRFRDRAVIEMVHRLRKRRRLVPYDSVRAMFTEGGELYNDAGFHEKNHVQLAIRSAACIRGYFRLPGL